VTRQTECEKAYEASRGQLVKQAQEQIAALRAAAKGNNLKAAEALIQEQNRSSQHVRLAEMRRLREEKSVSETVRVKMLSLFFISVPFSDFKSKLNREENAVLPSIIPYPAPFCPALPCPVLSCPVLPRPVLSCPVMSCPVLSCPALSCPVLAFFCTL
jgi:hypothetical protein